MADLRISELSALAGVDLAATDQLAVADSSASETKRITVTDLVGNATTLIADATIPGAKIVFSAGDIAGTAIADGGIDTDQLAADGVTAAKLADESTVDLVTTLPASGAFTGQIALDTDDDKIYCWDGSQWVSIKAAGSVNTVVGGIAGIVNVTVTTSGDEVTVNTTLDDTSAAAQFLAGPTGAAGAVSYRAIVGTDLPTASSSAKGGVQVDGDGLRMDTSKIEIDNDITASGGTFKLVDVNAKGLVVNTKDVESSDIPVATDSTAGAVSPGSDLEVTGVGVLNHEVKVAGGGTFTKVTITDTGHVSVGASIEVADIPDLPTSKLTTGTIGSALIGTGAITGAKLSDSSVCKFGGAGATDNVVTFPAADFKGQFFYDEKNEDLYVHTGNSFVPITVISGNLILAGTYDASTNLLGSVTTAGSAAGFTAGSALPAPAVSNLNYYVVVSDSGTGSGAAPAVALAPPDMLVSLGSGATFSLVDVSNAIAGQTAANISVTPTGDITGNNVQAVLQELDTKKLAKAGGTLTGDLNLGDGVVIVFEGSTDDEYETTITVEDPTSDHTITFPDVTGDVVTTGDTGTVTSAMIANDTIVNADVNSSAAIAFSKLEALNSGRLIVGNSLNTPAAVEVTGDVTISNAGVTSLTAGAIVNADINASAAIAVSKLEFGTARQLLQTNAGGTAAEFTSNVDIPGTLDVTGAAVFDSTARFIGNVTLDGTLIFEGATADDFETTLTVVDPTADRTITLPDATTTVAGLAVTQSFTKAQRGTVIALTDGATITPDFATGNNFSVTLAGNRTLANPSNLTAGQSGVIVVTQDGTGSRTLAFGSYWKFAGGTAPTLTTTASAIDVIAYYVESASRITAQAILNVS